MNLCYRHLMVMNCLSSWVKMFQENRWLLCSFSYTVRSFGSYVSLNLLFKKINKLITFKILCFDLLEA